MQIKLANFLGHQIKGNLDTEQYDKAYCIANMDGYTFGVYCHGSLASLTLERPGSVST